MVFPKFKKRKDHSSGNPYCNFVSPGLSREGNSSEKPLPGADVSFCMKPNIQVDFCRLKLLKKENKTAGSKDQKAANKEILLSTPESTEF